MAVLTSSARLNYVACVAMLVFTTICVSMRFIMRYVRRQTPLGADWLCLLGAFFFYAYCAVIIHFIFNVSHFHALDANPALGVDELTNLFKWSYVDEIMGGCCLTSIKLSILWFYYTIFSVYTTLRRVIQATAVACIVWLIVASCAIIFQCTPVDAYWLTLDDPAYCFDNPRLLLGYELSNFFLDVIILCIPITVVSKLRLATTKKVTAICTFLLGTGVCFASIFRLTAIWRPPNVAENLDLTCVVFLATVQNGLGIICSCLPTLGHWIPILAKPFISVLNFYKSNRTRTSNSHTRSSARQNMSEMADVGQPWVRIGEDRESASSKTWVFGNGSSGETLEQALPTSPPRATTTYRDVEAGYMYP
ncbi:hypothetical protein F5Y04DRAFT_148973 [Hypomontagnella monticulosa]|nr:hypothetical protein F5Y04DRAFT_148973 [Hypomontagnella monticulosa]